MKQIVWGIPFHPSDDAKMVRLEKTKKTPFFMLGAPNRYRPDHHLPFFNCSGTLGLLSDIHKIYGWILIKKLGVIYPQRGFEDLRERTKNAPFPPLWEQCDKYWIDHKLWIATRGGGGSYPKPRTPWPRLKGWCCSLC